MYQETIFASFFHLSMAGAGNTGFGSIIFSQSIMINHCYSNTFPWQMAECLTHSSPHTWRARRPPRKFSPAPLSARTPPGASSVSRKFSAQGFSAGWAPNRFQRLQTNLQFFNIDTLFAINNIS